MKCDLIYKGIKDDDCNNNDNENKKDDDNEKGISALGVDRHMRFS